MRRATRDTRHPVGVSQPAISRVLVVALVFLANGCARPTGPRERVDGVWEGVVDERAIVLTLEDSAGRIHGSGDISRPSAQLVAVGMRVGDRVFLTILSGTAVHSYFTLEGRLHDTAIEGVLHGEGFQHTPVRLCRLQR